MRINQHTTASVRITSRGELSDFGFHLEVGSGFDATDMKVFHTLVSFSEGDHALSKLQATKSGVCLPIRIPSPYINSTNHISLTTVLLKLKEIV